MSSATLAQPPPRQGRVGIAAASGAMGMTFVGGAVAVSSLLAGAPMFTAQAVRYAAACALLLVAARITGRRVVMPHGVQWLWLLGVCATGMVLFNIALVRGSRHAEPAVLGVAVACVPLLLAAIGPLLERRRPTPRVLAAAAVVTLGAALVQALGRTDGTGLLWALVVLGCEAGFSLLAVPVLPRLGPWGISVHTTWLAAVIFAVFGVIDEGPAAVVRLDTSDMFAVAYLSVGVTAVAFVLWYGCVQSLGASRAGLLTGVAPVAATAVGVAIGAPLPELPVWLGVIVVAAGLALGLAGRPLRRGLAQRRVREVNRCSILEPGPIPGPGRT